MENSTLKTVSSNSDVLKNYSFETILKLARVLQHRGHTAKAITYYQQLLAAIPERYDVLVALITLLKEQGDWEVVIDIYCNWLKNYPEGHLYSSQAHKLHIDALIHHRGIEAAFETFMLRRRDSKIIHINPDDLLCCMAICNEMLRLPYFLDYYRRQGMTKFLVVDNDSTDETLAYLLQQPDVYVWHTPASFNQANCGAAWMELLLQCHGVGHWVLWVDADELLYYPSCEERTIKELCTELEQEGKTTYKVIHLDMYADKPIGETAYVAGTDFLSACPYFDRQFYHEKQPLDGPFRNLTSYRGGVRQRVFGGSNSSYYLNKTPLFKYHADDVLTSGTHWINRPLDEISPERGALLHFKYFSTFHQYVKEEIDRKEMARNAAAQKKYARQLSADDALTLYDPLHSLRFENSDQLMQLGIIQDGQKKKEQRLQSSHLDFPAVAPTAIPFADANQHPFWSIMIPIDGDSQQFEAQQLERCLKSVMAQLPQGEKVQVELLYDRTSKQIGTAVDKVVAQIDDSRLHVHESTRYLGYPALMTLCLERTQGQWVHILSANDWLMPNFYATMQAEIKGQPEIGAAFCRFDYPQSIEDLYAHNGARTKRANAAQRVLAPLECATAGILADWLPRITVQNRVAFSAMVVQRTAYERVGGFCVPAASAATWEMCQRIAHHFPVWYEPQALAHTSSNPCSIDYRHSRHGLPLAHMHAAIDIASSYLPSRLGEELAQQARTTVATQAFSIAKAYLQQGNYHSAIANLGEGVGKDAMDSQDVSQLLLSFFSQIVG